MLTLQKDVGNWTFIVNAPDIDKVQERNGRVLDVPYKDWLDDGYGGLPRTLKTPAIPFTRSQCNKVLEMWLSELRERSECRLTNKVRLCERSEPQSEPVVGQARW